ncbi:hypothetical protein Tco_0749528 [Tanacetum coccineum]|uniref:Uncharacterized protein n=1 Tax=Tanacetum coccineum TaxID=301880 RepID=A0ABQ4Z1F2_9ASTR
MNDSLTVTSGVSIPVSDPEKAHEAWLEPDPEPMKEEQTGSDSGNLLVSLAGSKTLSTMDDDFLATALPKGYMKPIAYYRRTCHRCINQKVILVLLVFHENLDELFYTLGCNFFMSNQPKRSGEILKVERCLIPPYDIHVNQSTSPPHRDCSLYSCLTYNHCNYGPSILPSNTKLHTIDSTSIPKITPFIPFSYEWYDWSKRCSEVEDGMIHSDDVLDFI